MTTITMQQRQSLENKIYLQLMYNPEMGFGEMSNCREAATALVHEWLEENNIIEKEEN